MTLATPGNASEADVKTATAKAMRYCAYQERAPKEVLEKVLNLGLGLSHDQAMAVVHHLVQEDFINEARFAALYTGGKFRLKKWGKDKIRVALQQKGIGPQQVEQALAQLNAAQYEACLTELYQHKRQQLGTLPPLQLKQKLFNYLRGKGYETHLIHQLLQDNGL